MTKNAKDIIVASLVLGGIAMGIWAATWGIVGHQRGIYGGYSYGDARYHAAQALANRYGYDVLGGMTMGKPDVLKVHSRDTILNPRSQMRVFHLIGRKGVHYCVSVHEGHNARPLTFITKGCKF